MFKLIDPFSKSKLYFDENLNVWHDADKTILFPVLNNVIRFLDNDSHFYEGTYLNKIKFIPKSENILHTWPIWVISNGYLWEVKKQFKKNDYILEVGCASGVNYFGKRFNMAGLDLSFASLQNLSYYQLGIQADALNLPFPDNSLDGIISSYFWEHISHDIKNLMLIEFKRVLKPGGKIIFLYDVDTNNSLVMMLKKEQPLLYKKLFLDIDGHLGYETPNDNRKRFIKHGFIVLKHFGMERTFLQSNSVFEKFRHLRGLKGVIGKIGYFFTSGFVLQKVSIFVLRFIDVSFGKFINVNKSRILLSVLKKPL